MLLFAGLFSNRRHLAVVAAASQPELDTTVSEQPVPGMALCGMGTQPECSVAVRAKEDPQVAGVSEVRVLRCVSSGL